MKAKPLFLFLILALAQTLSAQVTVEVLPEQSTVLSGDSVKVAVKISNNSGQLLELGADSDWLTFNIDCKPGGPLPRIPGASGQRPMMIPAAQVGTRWVDLTAAFELTQIGQYRVTATVRAPQLRKEFASGIAMFDVTKGTAYWSREFGIPALMTNEPPDVRKYILQKADLTRGEIRLYAKITNPDETRLYKMLFLGPLVSVSQPEALLDRLNNVHVMYQNGAKSFRYVVVTPYGDIIRRYHYEYVNALPHLQQDANGEAFVKGARRVITLDDIPAPKAQAPTNPQSPATPAGS